MIKKIFILTILIVGLLVALGIVFSRNLYTPPGAIRVSEEFVQRLSSNQLEAAYELTEKNQLVGENFADFKIKVSRNWYSALKMKPALVGSHPPQSYGNRWKRWLQGREVEMPEVTIQYLVNGIPNFKVRLVYLGNQQWRVMDFQSTAL